MSTDENKIYLTQFGDTPFAVSAADCTVGKKPGVIVYANAYCPEGTWFMSYEEAEKEIKNRKIRSRLMRNHYTAMARDHKQRELAQELGVNAHWILTGDEN